jgi:hypothetical protein
MRRSAAAAAPTRDDAGGAHATPTTAGPAARRATHGHRAERLASALAPRGLPCRVEAREGLAIVYPASALESRLVDPAVRRQIVALGQECGFTHVAVALGAGTG